MSRKFSYDALYRRRTLRGRLRGVGANPRLVLGGTVAVLLVVVPAIIVVSLLAAGTLWDDGGAVAVLAMLLVGGAVSVVSVLHEGGKGSALEGFARDNDLDLVQATAVPEYAGSRFADGSQIVDQSVRTRQQAFVEVGDLFRIEAPRAQYNATLGRVQVEAPDGPRLFLRGRLAGRVAAPEMVTDGELQDRLTRFAGEHVVELARDEVTVYGTRRLDAEEPGRVEDAFGLLDELVARLDAARFPGAATASYDVAPATHRAQRRSWRPLKVVATTLVLLTVVPLGFAFVMSIIDNLTRSSVVAVLAVNLFLAGMAAVVALLLRRATGDAGDDGRPRRRRWWLWLVGAVAFVALGVVAVNLDQQETSDADKQSAAECYADDQYCQQDVSLRVWAEQHRLTRVGHPERHGCEIAVGVDRSTCPVRVKCPDGYADLVAELAGTPLEVVGAHAVGTQPDPVLQRTTKQIDRLVGQECHAS